MVNEPPIIRFVNLILYQAIHDGATQIVFAVESPPASEQKEPDELEILIAHLEHDGTEMKKVVSGPDFKFCIRYLTHGAFSEVAPPPAYLYWPVICRLCLLSGIRYWAKGRVEGFLDMTLGDRRARLAVCSDDLGKNLTLTEATAAQIEEHERREPLEVPSLPEPLPEEATPGFVFQPVTPPDATHAVVWFLSRTVFYAVAYICVCVLIVATRGSLFGFPTFSWQLNSLFWGLSVAGAIHWLLARRSTPG